MPQFDDRLQNLKLADLHRKEEEALVRTLAPKHGYKYINLHGVTIDAEALRLVPEEAARQAELAVFARGNKNVSVAIRNPNNPQVEPLLTQLRTQEFNPEVFMVSLSSVEHAWERYKDTKPTVAEKKGVLEINATEAQRFETEISSPLDVATKVQEIAAGDSAERISKTIEVIFGGALVLGASDIHIEPEEKQVRIRYRMDGVLWDVTNIDKASYTLLNSRIKLLAGVKLNIRDEAQDGRFTFLAVDHQLEIRTSILPGGYGESIVMRLLDPDASSFRMEKLGLNQKLHDVIAEELSRPNGAIITTGPTGSGKTTALYAFLQEVHKSEVKIITIEDPIEYKLPGIVQTQVSEDYSFATGLRSILRQDPDVIMVGEIRDREVAETAVHAALTGHLVFSTLHTNSAVGAFPRLIDMGVDYRMIGSAFNLILAQRLVRRLCEHCKVERDTTTEEQTLIARIMDEPVAVHTIFEAPGCDKCGGSGYKGRIGIFEGIRVDKAVEEAIIRDPRESVILEAAKAQGIPTMQQDGIMKVLAGITSLDELSRVIDLYNKNTFASEEKEEEPTY